MTPKKFYPPRANKKPLLICVCGHSYSLHAFPMHLDEPAPCRVCMCPDFRKDPEVSE